MQDDGAHDALTRAAMQGPHKVRKAGNGQKHQ
jgi:hypothetical protein